MHGENFKLLKTKSKFDFYNADYFGYSFESYRKYMHGRSNMAILLFILVKSNTKSFQLIKATDDAAAGLDRIRNEMLKSGAHY